MQLIALFGIPAAMTLAILKHRLYGIDVIISRAVVYGLLSAATAGVYAGIVLGIGATGADGPRPGSGSARSCARPRSGRPGRLCRPPSRSAPAIACRVFAGASRAVAVTHGGELLGALCLHKPPNEPLTSTEDELLRHLASQAGLVLRNAALTAQLRATIEELRASRRRLVEAQDAERRKIERNLHDGAQQLIALTIHLALLAESAHEPRRCGSSRRRRHPRPLPARTWNPS